MTFSAQQLDKAYAIVLEFPTFSVYPPVAPALLERWLVEVPGVKPDELSALARHCKAVEDAALGLAEQMRTKQITEEAARQELVRGFPFLISRHLEAVWTRALFITR